MAGLVTRFAPSPTGPLHLGHALAALTADRLARDGGGQMLLRFEDLDTSRCRPQWETLAREDLEWLGLTWPRPEMRQSERGVAYQAALDRLIALGVVYACACTRGDIRAALSAPQEGATTAGPDGPVYPGTCRLLGLPLATSTLRLDMRRAVALTGAVEFQETGPHRPGRHRVTGASLIEATGDIVLVRRGLGASYHLAVVVDDADQGVTLVSRGEDLFDATPVHRLLQILLDLPEPVYHHHRLVRDANGKRLAKRDDARALRLLRTEGVTPQEVRDMLQFPVIRENVTARSVPRG